jgi:prophage tail gpP-like protein
MSKIHNVVSGDRITWLSQRYYGTETKTKIIINANPQLKGRKISLENLPTIYPGDTLIIPDDPSTKKPPKTIDAEVDNAVTVKIDGQKFAFFSSFSLSQEIDSFDTFSCDAPFYPDELVYREAFRPFGYKSCDVFYGSDLLFSGTLLAPASASTPDVNPLSISGYPKCGVLNDCSLSISKYPMEFNNQDLEQITNSIISDYGVSSDFQSPAGNKFKKVALAPSKKVLQFIIELAAQRGLLVTNNSEGNLLFWQTRNETITATFEEGETPFISCTPNFNPQQFYSHITGIMPAKQGVSSEKHTVENSFLISKGIARHYNFTLADVAKQDLQNSVKIKAGKMFADAMQWNLTVWGHRNKDGNLYEKNTFVSVKAPRAMIYKDTKFLIKSAVMNRDENGGDTTTMSLVLPESYSGDIPSVFPFEE